MTGDSRIKRPQVYLELKINDKTESLVEEGRVLGRRDIFVSETQI